MSLERLDEKYIAGQHGPVPRLAYPIDDVPAVIGIPRTKIFEAVRQKRLMVRKAGRTTIIEHPELVRYLASLPIKGRTP